MRINECLRLRVKDFDFDNGCITVHDGKGGKSRNSLLPTRLIPVIKQLIEQARLIQQDDNLQGVGPSLPFALDRKYPSAYRQAAWMFVFPSSTLCNHPYNGKLCRHHLHDSVARKALKAAVQKQASLASVSLVIHFVTRLLRIYYKRGVIFALCKNS